MIRDQLREGAALAALILFVLALTVWADLAIQIIHR